MTITGRNVCLAILLALLVGHASVALHAATHVEQGAAECEICSSYGDLSKALGNQSAGHLLPVVSIRLIADAWNKAPWAEALSVRQRGPPASN